MLTRFYTVTIETSVKTLNLAWLEAILSHYISETFQVQKPATKITLVNASIHSINNITSGNTDVPRRNHCSETFVYAVVQTSI